MVLIRKIFLLLFGLCTALLADAQDSLWRADDGKVIFKSDAPLELITAQSKALRGIINPSKKSFGFTVRINSFEGFNSEIQQTHFLENYMEHKKFPQATFQGKFIEDFSFDTPGTYAIRAKGILNIHGVSKERIIKGNLKITKNSTELDAHFIVPLTDHGITIPKIVMQKIAEEIEIDIHIVFDHQQSK